MASGIESRSEHHLAGAILGEARSRGIEVPEAAEFLSMPGKGAAATVDGRRYYIGNHRLFEEMGWCYPELDARLAEARVLKDQRQAQIDDLNRRIQRLRQQLGEVR